MILGIFGAGGLGREMLETAIEINNAKDTYEKIIFIDDNTARPIIQNIEVLSLNEAMDRYSSGLYVLIAVGEPITRKKIIDRLKENDIHFATLIHPSVHIPGSTTIGKGCYIAPHTFISCNVKIGDNVLLFPNANIGHDCVLEDNVSFGTMSTIGGNCVLKEDVFISMGVSIIQGCTIGTGTVVGLGSTVFKDLPENVTALGNPARIMKKNNDDNKIFS